MREEQLTRLGSQEQSYRVKWLAQLDCMHTIRGESIAPEIGERRLCENARCAVSKAKKQADVTSTVVDVVTSEPQRDRNGKR